MTRLELPQGVGERLRSFDIHLGVPLVFPHEGPTTIVVCTRH